MGQVFDAAALMDMTGKSKRNWLGTPMHSATVLFECLT